MELQANRQRLQCLDLVGDFKTLFADFLREFQVSFVTELSDQNPADLVILRMSAQHLDTLASLRSSLPFVGVIDPCTAKEQVNLLNQVSLQKLILLPAKSSELKEHIELALATLLRQKEQQDLVRRASRQMKELESLNKDLEKLVEERTLHIRLSQEEEEEKLSKVRNLVRFIRDLTQAEASEQALELLRKELRKLAKVGDPLLALTNGSSSFELFFFHSGSYSRKKIPDFRDKARGKKVGNTALAELLANQLGRPFLNVIAEPLLGHSLLIVEHQLKDLEAQQFSEFVQEILRPFSITLERILLEEQLTEFTYRWERTFDGLNKPIAIIDIDYNLLRSNKKFSEKLIHKKCYQSFAEQDHSCEDCPVAEARAKGHPKESKIRINQKNFEVRTYPIATARQEERSSNFVNIYTDVTQSQALRLRVLQSEKMSALGRLAGNIAHELNNPLTGLRSLTQVLLQKRNLPVSVTEDLQEIEKAAYRSQVIIENLLNFAKGESPVLSQIEIDPLIHQTLQLLKMATRSHSLQLELNSQGQLIETDRALLQQVIYNLVNNACQAMGTAGHLTIRSRILAETKYVRIEISDSGPGIPSDILGRIFEPFFTTKKAGEGTGLGLSLSKQIVTRLGGRIWVESKLGQGSKFFVELPWGKNDSSDS